ncbi:MAG: hypothetical protein H6918_07365 [Sphingomonadaceae bacterium]|nr:hypothetical protein [Sphingomonadaceae bacterium]
MRHVLFAASLGLLASPLAAEEGPELPGWMAGCWEAVNEEARTVECWTMPEGGMMLGSAQTIMNGQTVFWEAIQIIKDDEDEDGPAIPLAMWVSPNGEGRYRFNWVESEEGGLTFTFAANDFPQKIRYWPDGELMQAEISQMDGSRRMSWTYRRMGSSD